MGDANGAITDLQDALTGGAGLEAKVAASIYLHLAESFAALGKREAASEAMARAHEAGFDANRLHPLEVREYEKLAAVMSLKVAKGDQVAR